MVVFLLLSDSSFFGGAVCWAVVDFTVLEGEHRFALHYLFHCWDKVISQGFYFEVRIELNYPVCKGKVPVL